LPESSIDNSALIVIIFASDNDAAALFDNKARSFIITA
jgi:hypothetical protein